MILIDPAWPRLQGSAVPAGALLTTIPKLGGLIAGYRLLAVAPPEGVVNARLLVAMLAVASMTLGNFAAFTQTDPRRLLAHSTISQVGYLLMAAVAFGLTNPSVALHLGQVMALRDITAVMRD